MLSNDYFYRMKKVLFGVGLLFIFLSFSAFAVHKFYVSIYQIDYKPAKKELQITSRIFLDDLVEALETSAKTKSFLGEKNQTSQDIALFQKYIKNHLTIKVNSKTVDYKYISSELENNVFISYFKVEGISNVKSIEVRNTALFEILSTQQNIIQIKIDQEMSSLLLTTDNPSGKRDF